MNQAREVISILEDFLFRDSKLDAVAFKNPSRGEFMELWNHALGVVGDSQDDTFIRWAVTEKGDVYFWAGFMEHDRFLRRQDIWDEAIVDGFLNGKSFRDVVIDPFARPGKRERFSTGVSRVMDFLKKIRIKVSRF